MLPAWQQHQLSLDEERRSGGGDPNEAVDDSRRLSLEDLVPDCNAIGIFERLGDRDVVFVCDFCDGHIHWEDVQKMPSRRALPTYATDTNYPNWQASAQSVSSGEQKTIVFAPLAIANHIAPADGQWEARIWCPFCDDYTYYDQDENDDTKYAQDEKGFPELKSFQKHLEWHHTQQIPSMSIIKSLAPSADKCAVM